MSAAPSLRRTALVAVVAGGALLVSGCSGSSEAAPSASAPVSTPSTTPSTGEPTSSPASTASRTRPAPVEAGAPLDASVRRHLAGRDGTYSWDLTYPVFAGGSVANEANRRMRATLDTAVAAWAKGMTPAGEPESKDPRRLTGEARVSVNDGRTLQVKLGTYHYVTGAAHGITSVFTLALDVTATPPRPLLLRGLLRDPAAAYAAFRRDVTRQAEADGASVEPDGVAAKDENWAAWQATAKGLQFSFGSYQLGAFPAADYTVPWSVVRPLLTPQAYALLGPRAQR